MKTYGKTLRKLIDCSGAKLSVVAEEVGYDVSYISKWCNKGHLPASKMATKINRTLAHLFASEIIRHEELQEFQRLFETEATYETLESVILSLLKDSYRLSSEQSGQTEPVREKPADTTRVLTHANEIYDFFHTELVATILSYHEPLEILCTLDLTRFLPGSLPEFPIGISAGHDIHISLAMNVDSLHADSFRMLGQLHTFLSKRHTISFDIFSDEKISSMNVLVIRSHMAVFCSLDDSNRILTTIVATDTDAVHEIYSKLKPLFKASRPLLHATDPKEFYRGGYRTDFYSRDNFQIFLARGFEFLLPKDSWQSVIQTAREKYEDEFIARVIERLQITWEEIFERGNVEFFVTKSSLIRYIETGEIIFADVVYRLTPEQRKNHIANILELTKSNPGILFYVIDDERLPGKSAIPRMSVFNNRKKAFLKNHARYSGTLGPHFYSVQCPRLISDMTAYFDSIREEPFCIRFDGASLAEFYAKYSSMILRMIDLS